MMRFLPVCGRRSGRSLARIPHGKQNPLPDSSLAVQIGWDGHFIRGGWLCLDLSDPKAQDDTAGDGNLEPGMKATCIIILERI